MTNYLRWCLKNCSKVGCNKEYVAERESHEILMVKANRTELSEMLVEATCYKRLVRHLKGFG